MAIVICKNCNVEFFKKNYEARTCNNHYCSVKCSNSVNNKSRKRSRKSKYCRCGCDITYRQNLKSKICDDCRLMKTVDNQTVEQAISNYSGTNRYRKIRDSAHNKYKKLATNCQICNYSNHVEICHIKAISTFSLDTLVKEVNAKDNIAFLCPNHHWELDHGFIELKIGAPGFEPGI